MQTDSGQEARLKPRDIQTTVLLVRQIVTVSDSVTASDTQPTAVTQRQSTGRVARTVPLITQVRTVHHAVTPLSHVKTRTTSAAELISTARYTHTHTHS